MKNPLETIYTVCANNCIEKGEVWRILCCKSVFDNSILLYSDCMTIISKSNLQLVIYGDILKRYSTI